MVRIFVEGEDDKKFIIVFLRKLLKDNAIDLGNNTNFDDLITIMGNKSKLLNSSEYKNISKQIGKKIKKVLFIFDCDFEKDNKKCNGMKKSEECFDTLLEKLNWNIKIEKNKHLHIFNRNLDYCIVETIEKEHCLLEIEKCLELNTLKPNRKPLASLYAIMYPKKPYNLEHNDFKEIKDKLIDLFKGIK
jgi:hypothetical protein